MNKALLRKWSWRPGNVSSGLSKKVILAKYGVKSNGWGKGPKAPNV